MGIRRRSAPNYELYYDDYIKLYIDTVMTVLQQENPRRQFVPSSPSDGAETVKEGYVAQNPYSDLYGDGKSSFWTDLWVRNHCQNFTGNSQAVGKS